jgi:hypothetical protein
MKAKTKKAEEFWGFWQEKTFYDPTWEGHPTYIDDLGKKCVYTITADSCNCYQCRKMTGRLTKHEEQGGL